MRSQSLHALIDEVRAAIVPFGHRPSTVWQYDYAWRRFEAYATSRGTAVFSTTLAADYLQELRQQYDAGVIKAWWFRLARKAMAFVTQQWETGEVHWTHLSAWGRAELPAHHAAVLAPYADHLITCGYARGTRTVYGLVAQQFLQYLDRAGVPALAVATLADVGRFVPAIGNVYQPTSMSTVLTALRHFLVWAAETRAVAENLTPAVPRSNGRKTVVVPALTGSEEQRLLATFDQTTAIGRRDYAICLLALRLGLRAGDIVRLQWSDFDWRRQTLTVVQQKTGRRLTTPLLADVGNAVIDYRLNGRPPSDSPVVFLCSTAPYRPLGGKTSIYFVVAAAMARAGIRQGPGQPHGPHTLRHALAARLLATGTPLPLISGVLGHADKDTTAVYLSTDTEHLRACALDLRGIAVTREDLRP